jgi:hypothetical protein
MLRQKPSRPYSGGIRSGPKKCLPTHSTRDMLPMSSCLVQERVLDDEIEGSVYFHSNSELLVPRCSTWNSGAAARSCR